MATRAPRLSVCEYASAEAAAPLLGRMDDSGEPLRKRAPSSLLQLLLLPPLGVLRSVGVPGTLSALSTLRMRPTLVFHQYSEGSLATSRTTCTTYVCERKGYAEKHVLQSPDVTLSCRSSTNVGHTVYGSCASQWQAAHAGGTERRREPTQRWGGRRRRRSRWR